MKSYVVFDSSLDNKYDYKYNLFIKTTPRQITSFQIITATLPRIPNIRYISMKIKNLEHIVSLNENLSIHDNAFALFYFDNNDSKYKIFNTNDIYPNIIHFCKPLQSLCNLNIEWFDNNNNPVYFTIPRFKISDNVFFHIDNKILFGIIISFNAKKTISYIIQDCDTNHVYENIDESSILQYNINDRIFIYHDTKFIKAIVLDINPYKLYLVQNQENIEIKLNIVKVHQATYRNCL